MRCCSLFLVIVAPSFVLFNDQALAKLPGRAYTSRTYPLVLHKDPPISHGFSTNQQYAIAGGSTSIKSPPNHIDDSIENQSNETGISSRIEVEEDEEIDINEATSEETVLELTNDEEETCEETKMEEEKHDAVIEVLKKKKGLLRRKEKIDSSGSALGIAKKLKNRNSLNLKRKFVHVIFGVTFGALNHALPRKYFMPLVYSINVFSVCIESFRYRKGFGGINKLIHNICGSSLRKHEMEGKFTGALYYFAGVSTSASFFPKTATTLGIFQLALADPSASYFGRKTRNVYWSRIEKGFFGIGRNKGLLGFAGGALVCFPFNYRILSVAKWGADGVPGGKTALVLASLALGAAGSLADLAVPTPAVTMPSKCFGVPLPPLSIDDNFVVPVVSAFACEKIFKHFGWSQGLKLSKYIIF